MSKSNPLDRAFQLLDIVACADSDMSLVELVQATGLPQSTTFRLASHLVESRMLSVDRQRRVYGLGSRARRLSLLLRGHADIAALVQPALETLAATARETAFFVVHMSGGARLVSFELPDIRARAFIHPGFDFPDHATASGKAIRAFLADLPNDRNAPLEQFQPATCVDPEALVAVYAEVRERGYAVNDSELDPGIYSVAAPVMVGQDVFGALGVVGPRDRMLDEARAAPPEACIVALREQARVLSGLLSRRRPLRGEDGLGAA